jgi:ribonucleoside-diphosphate reductase alpha chain
MRERLKDTRRSVTHKAVIYADGQRVKFFFTVGFYEDGRPGEIFMHMDESGSTLDGFADAWATALSLLLQRGEAWENVERKFSYQEFDPQGMSEDPWVHRARSVIDYVVRWIGEYVKEKQKSQITEVMR